MSKVITQSQKMQLLGLLTLARSHQAIVTQVEKEIRVVSGDDSDLLLDAIYNPDEDFEEVLKAAEIEVHDEQ